MTSPFMSASPLALLSRTGNSWAQNQTFAGRILCAVGSAASPSISFSSDTNTGLYRAGADVLSLVTNGTIRFQVDSAGAAQFGAAAAATGYTNAGDITLPSSRNVRAKNTAKAFGCISISGGVPSLLDGFNVSSITDTGVGRITANFTNAIADANYTATAALDQITDSNAETVTVASKATGSVELQTLRYSAGLTDLNGGQVNFIVMGN